jgi:hypothetical protein
MTTQPIVTRPNIENELNYWLSQIPPHQLLEILADKFADMSRTSPDRRNRSVFSAVGDNIKALEQLVFITWNQQ